MWPPNHQYQSFNITDFVSSAAAGCGGGDITNSVVIQKVSSDEPEDNPSGADGNTLNDIVIAPDCKSVNCRRERDGNLNGRVYTITFKVTIRSATLPLQRLRSLCLRTTMAQRSITVQPQVTR